MRDLSWSWRRVSSMNDLDSTSSEEEEVAGGSVIGSVIVVVCCCCYVLCFCQSLHHYLESDASYFLERNLCGQKQLHVIVAKK
mmetsp:Transcript_23752/g.49811  ORF Transcript_23752/g.49811 Transcript_23752/m.49811 type:complete len:83 (-) Transcript_23752:2-250(-)